MSVMFAGSHTSISTAEHLLFDILSVLEQQRCIATLRDEAVAVAEAFGEAWNPSRLSQMVQMDSAIRESLRLRTPSSRTCLRKVVTPEGVRLPDDTMVGRGNTLAMCSWGINHDASIYHDPEDYIYDRFVRPSSVEESDAGDFRSLKQATQVESSYLVWGFGKHTCPGRFFAVAMIKLIVSHLLIHYDVKPLARRPRDIWVDHCPTPMRNVNLEYRRRQGC